MKNSNIQWIGEIPDDWEVIKVKYISQSISKGNGITKEQVYEDGDINCVRYGEIYSKYENQFTKTKSKTRLNEITSPKNIAFGDILCAGTGELIEEIGKNIVYLGTEPCLAGGDIVVINHKQEPRFLNYVLNSTYVQEQKSSGKLKLKVVHISGMEIGNLSILLPPLATQTLIATYLDAKCSEIDSLIADINKQIETLNELMTKETIQAISQGITKNELKDSNIEWCPKVASHWEIKPFKYVLYERSEKNTPIVTNERLSLSIGMGVTLYSEKTTNLDRYKDDVSQYKIAHKGDLVMNSMNVIVGAVGTSNYFGCVSPAYYTFYDNEEDHVTAKFCEYVFLTPQMRKVLYSLGKGIMAIDRGDGRVNTCRLKVSKYDLGKILIAVPPIEEQRSIVKYLEGRKMEINAIISDKQKQISTLEAYKKSLIYEYVTGKKEVE